MLSRAIRPEKAIVFVHGWGGSASGTWAEFPSALRVMPEAASADAYFLNYPSRSASVAAAGLEVQAFLEDLLRAPAIRLANPSLPFDESSRPLDWRYTRIALVGHSMGAVVIRRASLNLDRAEQSKRLTANEAASLRLLFFAPAHRGSVLPKLVASGLGLDWLPGSALVGKLVSLHYRSLQDLENESDALKQLLEDNQTARARRASNIVNDADLHAGVVHAVDDKVVGQDRFDQDHDLRQIHRRNHRTACKPTWWYRRPVDELRSIL
jgi:pimeloyl-ACP methyl ester carboxylesterase